MIIAYFAIGIIALVMALAGLLWLRQPHGRHEADSMATAVWQPPTPMPELAPLPLSPPRINPRLLTLSDTVTAFYNARELDVAVAIDRAIMRSRENWRAIHA